MDKKVYTIKALYKKYDRFAAPSFSVSVGGTVFDSAKYHIQDMEVEQKADGTAGGCSFSAEGHFDRANKKWTNALMDAVKVGAKLVVKGGYTAKKELFYGYVDDYNIVFPDDKTKGPKVAVTGIDGLGYLMDQQKPVHGGKKKAAQIVRELLDQAVSAGFAKSVSLGTLSNYEVSLVKESGDDWRFLNMLAVRYGATLFVVDGEMIFDDVAANTTPILTLKLGNVLRSFEKRVSLAHQVGKVTIRGRSLEMGPISGTASRVTVGGRGKSAAQLVPAIAKAELHEFSEFVRTKDECQRFAQARLNAIAMGLVSCRGSCMGIPELIPGRYLAIEGADAQSNGSYLLTQVRHRFDHDGYTVEFEGKGAKV